MPSSPPQGDKPLRRAEAAKAALDEGRDALKGSYQTNAKTIGEVTDKDISRILEIKTEDSKKLMPEGYSGDIQGSYLDIVEEEPFVVREALVKCVDILKRSADGQAAPHEMFTLLMGERGIGKSAILDMSVMWARANGWITMFVPHARDFVTEKGCNEAGTGTIVPVAASTIRPKLWTQPLGAQRILQWMLTAHGDQLAQLPKQGKYPPKLYDSSETLTSIAERGLASMQFAGDALLDLRMELGKVTEFPVLIAVDQFNAFYWPTWMSSKGKPILAEQLMLAECFRFLDQHGSLRGVHRLKRGALLGATTKKYGVPIPRRRVDFYQKRAPHAVFYEPFSERGSEVATPAESAPEASKWGVVEVQPMNELEIRNMAINYRKNRMNDVPELLDVARLRTLKMLTGGVPRMLHEALSYPSQTVYFDAKGFEPFEGPRATLPPDFDLGMDPKRLGTFPDVG